jgi:hypothetical protein
MEPLKAVPYIALRPWHIVKDYGQILEVQTEREAQVLRDDGYIVLKHPPLEDEDEA